MGATTFSRVILAVIGLAALAILVTGCVRVGSEGKLVPFFNDPEDRFGRSVSINGDNMVIGVPGDDDAGTNAGAAYFFYWDGVSWTEGAKLNASDATAEDPFGSSVAISSDTVVIGAERNDHSGKEDPGAAYVFRWDGVNWIQEAKLTAFNADKEDLFGASVAIDGDTVVVGAQSDNFFAPSTPGSAHVFLRGGTTWSQQGKLTTLDAIYAPLFGTSVAISGDLVVVGAVDNGCSGAAGAAYVFLRTGTEWIIDSTLTTGNSSSYNFGKSVAISGDTIVVGANDDLHAGPQSGAAYVFNRVGFQTWQEEAKLTATDAAKGDLFGVSVSINGDADTVVIGATPGRCFEAVPGKGPGASYVFRRDGTSWSQYDKMMASDAANDDHFGESVSISGSWMVV